MVMNAGYQTEFIGGDFVPTMTVNTNLIPTNGLSRLEVLKDGASAIYGADAVAGVVNNVMDTDYEGLSVSLRGTGHEHFDAVDTDVSVKYGFTTNDGATNIAMFFKHRDRERISACEDERWCLGDYDQLLPDHLSAFDGKGLDNRYGFGWFQLDFASSSYNNDYPWVDNLGETQLFPIDHPKCSTSGALDSGMGTCLVSDKLAGSYSVAPQELRDYRGSLSRSNAFIFITHQMNNGMEMFAEIGKYQSKSEKSTMHGSFKADIFRINEDYYWFTQIPE